VNELGFDISRSVLITPLHHLLFPFHSHLKNFQHFPGAPACFDFRLALPGIDYDTLSLFPSTDCAIRLAIKAVINHRPPSPGRWYKDHFTLQHPLSLLHHQHTLSHLPS
jgi:hypothetical protein